MELAFRMPMNILVIPTTDWLRHPTPHRHHYLAEQMCKRHNVSVLYFDIFDGEKTWETNAKLIPTSGFRTKNLLIYYLVNTPFHWWSLRKAIRNNDIDVIYAAHPTCSYLGYRIAKGIRKKNILCVYDFNDYTPEGGSLYYKSPILKKIIKGAGIFLLKSNIREADVVIAVSNPMHDYVKDTGYKNVKMVTNGVNTEFFKMGLDTSKYFEELKINGPVIGFVGTIEKWFDLESVFHNFQKLLEDVPDAKFLLVGGSIKTNYIDELKDLCKKLSISESVIMTGLVPYSDVPYYISMMDIAIMPPLGKNLLMGKFGLPNKIFQYMACGKPVLTAHFPEIERVASDAVYVYNNTPEFKLICNELLKGKNEEKKKIGLELAKKNEWEAKAREIENIFEKNIIK